MPLVCFRDWFGLYPKEKGEVLREDERGVRMTFGAVDPSRTPVTTETPGRSGGEPNSRFSLAGRVRRLRRAMRFLGV